MRLVVLFVMIVVYGLHGSALADVDSATGRIHHGALPPSTAEMREAILGAVHSGSLDELQIAIDLNELQPDFGVPSKQAPIDYLRKLSGDGKGHDILAILGNILEMPPARIPIGADAENASIYVWPYVAERPLKKLKPSEHVDLLRLMSADQANATIKSGKWRWWRLVISADGTWLSFKKYPN